MARPVKRRKTSFKVGCAIVDRLDIDRGVAQEAWHERVGVLDLEAQRALLLPRRYTVIPREYARCCRVVRRAQPDDIAAHRRLERDGRIERDQAGVIHDADPVAVLRLVHVVRRHEDGDALALAQFVDVRPDVLARLRVEPDGRLIEEEDGRVVQQPARDLQPPLHATGEGAHLVARAVGQIDHLQHLADAPGPFGARDVIDHAVEAEILLRRDPVIEAVILEDDADRLAHARRVARHVVAIDARRRPPSGEAGCRAS